MKTHFSIFLFLIFSSITNHNLVANNIRVSNVTITDLNPGDKYAMVYFDLSWDNSWRTSSITSNWDAAWVFVKYRKVGEPTWNHAILNRTDGTGSGDGHIEPANCNIASSNDTGVGGAHGVFIHADADRAQGTVNYTGIKLRWNYGANGLADNQQVEISVMAIEMVYIPQGAFYVGSGGTEANAFYKYPTTTNPYQITSEAAINVGATTDYLYYAVGGGDQAGPIPAAFPKGYNAFYCMKYEITQDQYVAFLNKLTTTQASTENRGKVTKVLPENKNRNGISESSGIFSTTNPYVACNFLSAKDVAAYLDWAALRPMTELEFEKAARGPNTPIANEYAWGTATYTTATGVSTPGLSNEIPANSTANSNINTDSNGPMRVGCFGQGINTRTAVGAGYYGVMELSGNVHEKAVTAGSVDGRAFTGTHGNGVLDIDGKADATSWSLNVANGSCYRGGSYSQSLEHARISDRFSALIPATSTGSNAGGRGVRTAP